MATSDSARLSHAELTPDSEKIGPYTILSILGEGGMGTVYEAEEMAPVRRRVALKVIKRGLDSADVLARFDAERRALAVMNHEGIAQVLNAGTTTDGQPWFAMELVRGAPLAMHCDQHRLSIRERLELFIDVCLAVQHAHQKGVIHRDLKPSNVLVIDRDGVAQPKVIDFGIAKALGPQTEDSLQTISGQTVGTAAYMSPEQADPTTDVDTRADVYSLGVMLYEIMVGDLPLDPAVMGIHNFMVMLASRETMPPSPSVRLNTSKLAMESVARLRRTDPARLTSALRGDLDWVVMKAMHAQRQHRYESAASLAADLRRHLDDEPVTARPPSAVYRIGKFMRRHRAGVVGAAIVTMSILAGGIVSTVAFVRASRAERAAAREADAARQVTDFLVDLFRVSDPGESRGNSLTAREILERGEQRVTTELAAQPELQTRMLQTIGTVHAALGEFEAARLLLENALRTRERDLGPNDPAVGETLTALGDLARARGDYESADGYFQRALSIRESAFGREHIAVATTLGMLAALRVRQGRSAEAESLYLRLLPLDHRVRGPADLRTSRDMRGLAAVYWAQKRYAAAESLWTETLALLERTQPPDHPDIGSTLNNLGTVHYSRGDFPGALPYYERARPIIEASLGPSHPTTASVINNLAEVQWKLGRLDRADSLFRRALSLKEAALAPGTPSIAVTLSGLAGVRRDQGRFVESESFYKRALVIRERALRPGDPDIAETLRDYSNLLLRMGRVAESAAMLKRLSITGDR
jgi:non-specific serine/threonine protein kinase/serine/threonine-protein kinase